MSGPTRVTPPGTQEATKAPPAGQEGPAAPAKPPGPLCAPAPSLERGGGEVVLTGGPKRRSEGRWRRHDRRQDEERRC